MYSKFSRSELIDSIKELISLYQTKSKELFFLKESYVRLIREHDRTHLKMTDLKEENRYFKKMTDKWSNKPLTESDIAVQEFIVTGIDISKVSSMIYLVRRNKGEGIGEPKTTLPPCFPCTKKGLKAFFLPQVDKTKVLNQTEPKAFESSTLNKSESRIPKSKVLNKFGPKTS